MITDTSQTYEERGVEKLKAVQVAEIQEQNRLFGKIVGSAVNVQDGIICGVNFMREAGIKLAAWCGHDQMSRTFWDSYCEGKLVFDFETAKHFMAVARKTREKKIKTLAEAAEYFQPLLIATNLLELPERTESHSPTRVSITEKFLAQIALPKTLMNKMLNEKPIEDWDVSALKKVQSETEWIVELNQKVERLLKGKK